MGAASRDIDARAPRGWRLGGGVTYGSLAAARLGLHVRAVVGLDDEAAATAPELDLLRSAGVELELVRLVRGPVFDNQQTPGGRVQLVHQVSDALPVDAVPDDWRRSPAVMLVPVAGELSDDWAALPAPGAFVGLAWQGLFRRLIVGRPVERVLLRPGPL
ncbi:MAG TPA: hypothetical protein VK992_04030, partial [Candidatus Caenarcaniphilales bacterium]|nr:hypothetical protein [Candidatus Caenarcaniphilales bacterium]